MIAISTEPVPVSTAVNEQPRFNEPEEYHNDKYLDGTFAKLLSGLLQKTDDNLPEIELADSQEIKTEIVVLSGEETDTQNDHGFIKNLREASTSEENFLDKKIPDEHLASIVNPEYYLASSVKPIDLNDDFLPGISGLSVLNNENHLPEAEIKSDFIAIKPEEPVVSQLVTSSAAVAVNDETDKEILDKKESSLKDRFSIKTDEVKDNFIKEEKQEKIVDIRKQENDNPGRLDEFRSRQKRGFTIEVKDNRTETVNALNNQTRTFSAIETSAGRTLGENSVRDITLDLRLPEARTLPQTTWEARAGSAALENMLARELHQNFNGDIVRHASMALKDGGAGTIRIALHPESLGNVKIHLEMTENKITGRIVVESTEALNAFRKELSSLEQAFRDSGFADADLNLSLTADGQDTDNWEQEPNSFTPRMAALRLEGEQDTLRTVDVFYEHTPGSINVLA